MSQKEARFKRDLTRLINRNSLESHSDTPDFVLADYLMGCLKSYQDAVQAREQLAGRNLKQDAIKQENIAFGKYLETGNNLK